MLSVYLYICYLCMLVEVNLIICSADRFLCWLHQFSPAESLPDQFHAMPHIQKYGQSFEINYDVDTCFEKYMVNQSSNMGSLPSSSLI